MGRMTPPVPGVRTPHGEKIVFQKIQQTTPREVNALHSLEIRDHYKKDKMKGEADFCVIYPNYGIFIIEVKGGGWEIKNGQWYPKFRGTTSKKPLNESPFEQAEYNFYSINKKIISQFPEMKKMLFTWGVVLPHASFPESLFELDGEEWRVWDATNINDSFEHYLKLLALKEKQRLEEKGRKVILPTDEDCEKIKQFLRPDYECAKLIKVDVDNANTKIENYTKDQFVVLDQMIDNERLIIKGGAGTGKTLIAAEAVRRNIQNFKKVLFLCKNREITDTVRQNLADEGFFTLYPNYPTIKTWDAFLEHELLYDTDYLKKIKNNYSNIGQYFNQLPSIYIKRCSEILKDIN
ncbi:MAG: DEAD/DEAH box helicase family protein, partial [Flavobacteriaceae bacterium]|nr:DEAD/DEAH box helicase family protein [Flavobacteriaceae bacterium]